MDFNLVRSWIPEFAAEGPKVYDVRNICIGWLRSVNDNYLQVFSPRDNADRETTGAEIAAVIQKMVEVCGNTKGEC